MTSVSSKEFLNIQATVECIFTLKIVNDMTITYNQLHRTDKYSQQSSIICPAWLCGWVFVYELTQQIFQRRFNVVFRLIWRRDVAQRQINVESTLRTSELKFTTFNNVETTLYILKLNWTTLGNVGTTLSFSTSVFTTFSKAETTLQIWQLEKN